MERLASPRLTLALFPLMILLALQVGEEGGTTVAMLLFCSLLSVNLLASISVRQRLRRDLPLLLFHLSLFSLIVLFGIARLIYFDGTTVVTAGTYFKGTLVEESRGPLHGERLASLKFANEGMVEHFPEYGKYHETRNRVRYWDSSGKGYTAEIGDDRPLLLDGFRIYTNQRRGFSPLFYWQPDSGAGEFGTVQLSEEGVFGMGPSTSWQLPGGPEIWVMLNLEQRSGPKPGGVRLNLGAEHHHHLTLEIGDQRHILREGESIDLDGGRLGYLRLNTWMGYRLVYDPTGPWLVAVVIIGIFSLLWFYARLMRNGRRLSMETTG